MGWNGIEWEGGRRGGMIWNEMGSREQDGIKGNGLRPGGPVQ